MLDEDGFEIHEIEVPEKILCAAIWVNTGKPNEYLAANLTSGLLFCGFRHYNCLQQMMVSHYPNFVTDEIDDQMRIQFLQRQTQGFLTNKNRFVDRKEGMSIAYKAKQTSIWMNKLTSEMLY